ncbi:NACHT and WD repeat domain-containing protein 2 [Plodia interpunctella]|uniref:NACHT and WD repeat domain-containing protein 2 n=1 Tax=Plodia interpunctella TaxID=58824 RepID=UPI002367C97A|nr:NACHT and WD repeat domain-containing protein 2 [Plodia interpunctella]XP_053618963.1 NACHT and WD repeat domain-containing protein 2 [Plodia interpunctella]
MDERTIDLIFGGSLKSLPPVSSKIVRIFTSSTFTDTTMERNTLMAKCYPRIKDYCREKHGLEFQVVDMRWGVRDEATDDHMTTELCMREIKNCQRLSMGPNFVVFLGQKYGYRPIPTYVLSSELQMLRDELAAGGVDVILLDTWYKKDSNAVPPVSVLQPISSILINFNNKRVPKLQAEDQAVWWDTLNKMQKLFRKASLQLYNAGKIDKDTMHNYFMSVTEREVINGVLNVKNTKNHCLAYVRYINNINLQNLKKASNFVDILNRSLDTEASKLLADLRDVRLPEKIETTNIQKYTVEWIGRDGLDPETHGEYLNHFITHFYKNIVKLVDRAMRKEDSSAQGQIVTEILQHLHACNNSVKVFHGREDDLKFIENYIKNSSDKPLVLYGEGGCGKTSLLSKSAAKCLDEWFADVRPTNVIRFLGTTPDSSALTPTLISICQQISYNFALPFEGIPDDLVPLTAYFKQLLTIATEQQPLLLFLDSVDQLTGIGTENNKVSWLPTRLPPHCKIMVTCAREETNPEVSKEYEVLKRMIDSEENFLEVTALGEDLAMQVLKLWMASAARDLSNYQWRLVSNAISSCSLPIFVKLVFAEVCRWRSYTKPTDTHLASTVMDSIMMLFERIEKQHGRLLVFHALAYITAARSGLSETELEDLISLDDKVLDDVYQYHLPPVRRIPPLLWTRIRNDLPNYLSEREADGVSVMNWYHRQFRDTARERYFKNMNMAMYFHSMIADYYLGIWGGGTPKPFKYTEIQRHRFNLADKEGIADRKVPLQPLVFTSADGATKRYNLRKFGELPFHLVRSKRFTDLYAEVLFNYEWLHAKLNCCPLQAVLADFEDAKLHVNKDAVRELMLVADALRLGGAILGTYSDMLAPQLVGRLLPEAPHNPAVASLLKQCHDKGKNHCALLPSHHCLHTPGGPLKYSLEGHQFAVFAFRLSSDKRYVVSISSRVISWDLSTSDLARDLCPQLEGIMQNLELSPDNKWAAASTNNSVSMLLNMLTSEYITINNPLDEGETVRGVAVLNHHMVIYGPRSWVQYSMRGEHEQTLPVPDTAPYEGDIWEILSIEFRDLENFVLVMWSGDLDEDRLLVQFCKDGVWMQPLRCRGAMALNKNWTKIYTSDPERGYQITIFELNVEASKWIKCQELNHMETDTAEAVLQLKRGKKDRMLLATTTYSFVVWDFDYTIPRDKHEIEIKKKKGENKRDEEEEEKQDEPKKDHRIEGIVLKLPHTIRNISTKMTLSNSFMISKNNVYAVAGVRKNLYVWSLETTKLIKVLDAHFGRIVQLEPLTVGSWNNVITSSIDRTVKIWNIDNIFEQVHKIDRQELPIDSISLARDQRLAATATRSCWGLWDTSTGKLIAQLADAPLGAIVTHAVITPSGENVITAESGNVVIWDTPEKQVIFKEEQKGVKQVLLLEDGTKFITISMKSAADNVDSVAIAAIVARTIPDGEKIYTAEYEVRSMVYRAAVVSVDEHHIVAPGVDKSSRDCLHVFHAKTGTRLHRIPIKNSGIKDIQSIVALPHKPLWVAVVGSDKAGILDIKTKRHVRIVPRWNGACTKDGKIGLCAPSRGGLDLIELKRGTTIEPLISRAAEGVFSIITMFSSDDLYVFYYHSGRKTLRVFRTVDGKAVAEYRAPAEVTGVASAHGGKALAIASQDGCLTILNIVDPNE